MLLQVAVRDIGQVTEIEPSDVRRIKCHTKRGSARVRGSQRRLAVRAAEPASARLGTRWLCPRRRQHAAPSTGRNCAKPKPEGIYVCVVPGSNVDSVLLQALQGRRGCRSGTRIRSCAALLTCGSTDALSGQVRDAALVVGQDLEAGAKELNDLFGFGVAQDVEAEQVPSDDDAEDDRSDQGRSEIRVVCVDAASDLLV